MSLPPITDTSTDPETDGAGFSFFQRLVDLFDMLCAALTVVILLFIFVGRHSPINGTSMYPTFEPEDIILVSSYVGEVSQGDIVVFQNPWLYEKPFIKRVIATEGQTVDIDFESWSVYVDGVLIDEPYINREDGAMLGSDFTFPLTVPEGCVWCMGDNRNHSDDSRDGRVGPVDTRYIIGRAVYRIYPVEKIGKVE